MRFSALFVLTALRCASSARKAVSPKSLDAAPVESAEAAWAQHLSALADGNLSEMESDYSEGGEISTWSEPLGKYFTGGSTSLYAEGWRKGHLSHSEIISVISDDRQTWTIWNTPGEFEIGTTTYIYDKDFKIAREYVYSVEVAQGDAARQEPKIRQRISTWYQWAKEKLRQIISPAAKVPNDRQTLDVWNKHADAWRSQDMEEILKDFTEDSIMRVYNGGHGPFEFKGLAGIRKAFTGVLADLAGVTDYQDRVEEVDEDYRVVHWVWQAPEKSYVQACETVIFDENMKIHRQNVFIRRR